PLDLKKLTNGKINLKLKKDDNQVDPLLLLATIMAAFLAILLFLFNVFSEDEKIMLKNAVLRSFRIK
ncbi:MAG: hypothetical protein QXH60_02655, partial [Candidatus Pacearchaeota archaeon]